MIKVMTLVGTRPELIKMSRVIAELDKQVHHILVHSGQNHDYELAQLFFDDLGIRKPDHFLKVDGETPAKAIADIITKADDIFELEKPDALLLYGDTNTGLAIIAAKRRKIPVFHMEAGNRCFDQRVPEELNRKVIDHLSDINMVLSEHARRYLIAEGIRPETIIKTGSHMNEVFNHYMPCILNSDILRREQLIKKQYFVVSTHREENVDSLDNMRCLLETLRAIATKYQFPIIVSTHPRTQKSLDALNDSYASSLIRFIKPFGFFDYCFLQMNACCVISDSGSITEEAMLLNLPAITIRETHERPEGMDAGTLIMTGLKKESVLEGIRIVASQHDYSQRVFPILDNDCEKKIVSKQIVRIVLSYTDYINRLVWSKTDVEKNKESK